MRVTVPNRRARWLAPLVLLLLACGARAAAAGDAYYILTIHNESRGPIVALANEAECASINKGGRTATSIDPDRTFQIGFFRSGGSCHGKQGWITLKITGSDLPLGQDPDVQKFWYDAEGGLEKRGPDPKFASVLELVYNRRTADNVEYTLHVLHRHVPISDYHPRLLKKVGIPATRNPRGFATRSDLGVSEQQRILLDLGGEGRHSVGGIISGFTNALNFNDRDRESQPPYNPIPNLIWLDKFETNPPYPVADGLGDYVVMQGAPLTENNVDEIARITKIGGKIGLWINLDTATQQRLSRLAQRIGSQITSSQPANPACVDEFNGHAGFPKQCLTRTK